MSEELDASESIRRITRAVRPAKKSPPMLKKNNTEQAVRQGDSAKVNLNAQAKAAMDAIAVIPEEDRTLVQRIRYAFHGILQGQKFDMFVGVLICFNAFTIGYQADLEAKNEKGPFWLGVLEAFFLVVYTQELALRYFVHRAAAFINPWVKFDLILVVLSWFAALLDNLPVSVIQLVASENEKTGFLGLFRLFRIGKLIRPLRVIAQFRTLWLLVRGLLSTALTVIYTFMLLFLFLYIFACLAIELIAKDRVAREDPEFDAIVNMWFPDMWTTIVSLTQFVTCDSVSGIYRDLVLKQPWLMSYFSVMMMVLSISLMNLVTALIVEGARDQSAAEKTIERKIKLKQFEGKIPRLIQIFEKIDMDNSGTISLQDLTSTSDKDSEFLLNLVPAEDMTDLFHILDWKASGEVDYDEFLGILRNILSSDLPLSAVRMLKEICVVRSTLDDIKDGLVLDGDKIRAGAQGTKPSPEGSWSSRPSKELRDPVALAPPMDLPCGRSSRVNILGREEVEVIYGSGPAA
jgi:hypothetical protein